MICTRDRPREIADCMASCAGLRSVLEDGRTIRVVVCVADNNDPPREADIRATGTTHGLDLRYGHEARRGYASVRNRALALALDADVDLAIFIDDDSTADPGLVVEHVCAIERYAADAILGRIEGLSQRAREGRRVFKAGTGNVSIRRRVFDPGGIGLRFDPRLDLIGFEDFEFFGDLVRAGGTIYQSTRPVAVSSPTADAAPTSIDRPLSDRMVFARMEGRNEIAVTLMRHGFATALVRLVRRQGPQLLRGLSGVITGTMLGTVNGEEGRRRREMARVRLARFGAGLTGLWRPAYDRPLARRGTLREVEPDRRQ
jgi:glycosyltransferase involved in cell wall biosynthesis